MAHNHMGFEVTCIFTFLYPSSPLASGARVPVLSATIVYLFAFVSSLLHFSRVLLHSHACIFILQTLFLFLSRTYTLLQSAHCALYLRSSSPMELLQRVTYMIYFKVFTSFLSFKGIKLYVYIYLADHSFAFQTLLKMLFM